MKAEFEKQVNQLLGAQKERKLLMADERYMELLTETKEAMQRRRISAPLSGIHYRRLKRFEVTKIGDSERLVHNNEKGQGSEKLLFCMASEMFDVVHKAHIETGHRKEKGMEMELKRKYCNITREVIAIYLKLCRDCTLRRKDKPKDNTITMKQAIVSRTQLPACCKIDIIDMEAEPDKEYKYILIYQDQDTKFLILRPLERKTPEELADVLFDIFCLIGTPSNMACNIDRRYCHEIRRVLSDNWNVFLEGVELPLFETNQVSKYIHKSLKEWMAANEIHNWAANLRIIQSLKNNTFHPTLQRTPQEAMFGKLKNKNDAAASIQTEKKLKEQIALLNQKLKEVNEIKEVVIGKCGDKSGSNTSTEPEIVTVSKTKINRTPRRLGEKTSANVVQKCPTFNVGERVMVNMSDADDENRRNGNGWKRRKNSGTKSVILEKLFCRNEALQSGSSMSKTVSPITVLTKKRNQQMG